MPRLPEPTGASRQIGAQTTGARIDTRFTGQGGRDLQALGQGIAAFGQKLQKINDTWEKAKVTNQYTTANNELRGQIDQVLFDADSDANHENIATYMDKLEDIRRQEVIIDNEDVMGVYDSDMNLDIDQARLKVQGIFRGKTIAHQRGQIVKDTADTQTSYNNSFSAVQRFRIREDYKDRLTANRDAGFISEDEYQDELLDMKNWEFNRAMRALEIDPQLTIEAIDGYDFQSEKEKQSVIDMGKKIIRRQDVIREIANLDRQRENEAEMNNILLNNTEMSVAEKTTLLRRRDLVEDFSKGYASKASSLLTSEKAVDAVTKSGDMAQILRMTRDINRQFESIIRPDSDNKQEYLKNVSKVQQEILSRKDLSMADRARIQAKVDSYVEKNVDRATSGLREDDDMDKAIEYFDKNLPAHRRDEALRFYFDITFGKEVSASEGANLYRTVVDNLKSQDRTRITQLFNQAAEFTRAGADLRVGQKNGKDVVVLFKDGVAQRVVAE